MQFPIEIACQEDIITQLRIRVAVLENELNHAKREKEDAVNASVIIARTLGSALSSTTFSPYQGHLESGVSALRKENCAIRGELQQANAEDEDETAWITNIVKKNIQGTGLQQGTPTEIPRETSNAASLQSQHHTPSGFLGQQNRGEGPTATNRHTASQHIPLPASPASDTKGFVPNANSAFSHPGLTPSPNDPNSPLLNPRNPDIRDIGTWSLEDTIGNEDLESPLTTNATIKRTGQFETPAKDIDAQLREHELALASFTNVPAPTVLKTGFEVGKSRRGEEYRWDPDAPPKWEERWGTAEEYIPLRGPKAGSSGLSFRTEEPKDDNFNEQLWDSVDEYHKALRYHQKSCRDADLRFPELFRYGHYFIPGEAGSNSMRSVLISNLPEDISLREVLLRVRGGEIVSAVLANTVKLTGGMTALVQFVHEAAAEEYSSYASAHPITFGDEEKKAEVTLLFTPTFPLSIPSQRRIHEHGQTRCLCIRRCPNTLRLNKLERDLACGNRHRADSLVDIFIDEKGDLNLEFASISAAGSAYGILTNWRAYKGLDVLFLPDPCSGPLEDLEHPLPPRPPMIPRNRFSVESDGTAPSSDSDSERCTFRFKAGTEQRKRIAALTTQKVEIPNLSGAGIASSSWADEVNEEAEETSDPSDPSPLPQLEEDLDGSTHLAAPPNSLDTTNIAEDVNVAVSDNVDAIMVDNVNELLREKGSQWFRDEGYRKPPTGLAGSKYASLMPSFADSKMARSRRGSSFGIVDGAERGKKSNTPPKLKLSDLLASSSEEGTSGSTSEKSTSPMAKVRGEYADVMRDAREKGDCEEKMMIMRPSPTSRAVFEGMIKADRKGKEVEIPELDLNASAMTRAEEEQNGKAKSELVMRNPDEINLDLDEDDDLPPQTSSSPAPAMAREGQEKVLENILKDEIRL